MINISYSFSNDYRNYFTRYPYLFDKMKVRASKRVLEMWQRRAFVRAPYRTGTLRREIKALYNERILVAGQFLSRDYALIQDVGGRTGRGHKSYIRPKHYFFRMAEESEPEVVRIYEEEVEKIIR